jgi:hypothetical protein
LQEYGDAGLLFRIIRSCVHEHADASHALALLRTRRERPRSGRTANEPNELAPLHHSITSSARASSLSGTVRPSALWLAM